MAEVVFNQSVLTVLVLGLQIEVFYFLCYSPAIMLGKYLKINKTNENSLELVQSVANTPYFYMFFMSMFFLKTATFNGFTMMLFIIIFLYKLSTYLEKVNQVRTTNNIIYLILPTFIVFLYLLFFVQSLLTLFFFIELYGVLYYFCFLTSYRFTSQTLLKYKNGLLLLLWNNFLTTFFLAFGCFLLSKYSGSTNFNELKILYVQPYIIYIYILGLAWKVGLPLFHFFKLEVYKYLLRENVFLFSILTTLMNVVILFICITQPVVFTAIYSYNLIVITVLFTIVLAINSLTLPNLLYFFALSGVFTMSTVLVVFLI